MTSFPVRPLRVAIIGAGPSAFYAAGALIQQQEIPIRVDLFDRLPAPYGLVRYGVAPDHQKIKNVEKVYFRTAQDERVRFFGNVEFGRDLSRREIQEYYDQVVYAVGAQADRRLGIPGEDLEGSTSATEFVAWYNGHPDYTSRDFNLEAERVVVVGVGNVAVDVTRILARSADELASTDIADHALARLRQSKVRDIYVLARRGPAQSKFSPLEIKEIGELENADVILSEEELELDPESRAEADSDTTIAKNIAILHQLSQRAPAGKPRRIHFRFLVSPVELLGESGRVKAVRIERNRLVKTASGYLKAEGTRQYEFLEAGMVLRSVGYASVPLPEVVFDERRAVIPNQKGRVIDPSTGEPLPGEYVVGWAKRGPTGLIGTNKGDAIETVQCMLEDAARSLQLDSKAEDPEWIGQRLRAKGCRYLSFEDWLKLDQVETELGRAGGRPRVKIIDWEDVLEQPASKKTEPPNRIDLPSETTYHRD